MKEFVNKIQISVASEIDSISGTTLTMKSGGTIDPFFSTNDLIPEEQDNKKSGNRYFAQSLKVICDSITTTLYNRYRNRKVVIKLYDSSDNEYLLGSIEYPARCVIKRDLNHDTMNITCDTPDSLVP